MPKLYTTLSLLLLLSPCSAAKLKPRESKDEDGVERYAQFKLAPKPVFVACGAMTAAATAAQAMKPDWLSGVLGAAAEGGVGKGLVGFLKWMQYHQAHNPLALTMGHGLLLKAIAEVLAQMIPQAGKPLAWLDPLRVVRGSIAGLISSSYTFYVWTRLNWVRAIKAPKWIAAVLGMGAGTTVYKTFVTQLVYRPINVFLFLFAQAFFRGDDARALVTTMKTKFVGGLTGGIAFFTVSNLIMFSIPVPFLHPIIGGLAGLIFNVWLAMVAYAKNDAAPAKAAAADSPLVLNPLASLTKAVSASPLGAFPATASLLGAVGMLESIAAASLYAQASKTAAISGKPGALDSTVGATPATRDAVY